MAEHTPDQPVRTPRDSTKRDVEKREMTWTPSGTLPVPKPDANYTYRWIRRSYYGVEDPTNMSKKIREGWEPVDPKEHPELALFFDDRQRREKTLVEVGGLILSRMPQETAAARRKYYESLTAQQMKSVDERLAAEQTDSRMPIFNERRSKVTQFGRGS